jgi:hypothetical protein
MGVVTQCSLFNTRVCCVVSYGVAPLLCTVEFMCVARVGGRPGAGSHFVPRKENCFCMKTNRMNVRVPLCKASVIFF